MFLFVLVFIILILIRVTFFTLFEQKILRFVQSRQGPNKLGLIGLLQPFSDGIKLFLKEIIIPIFCNYFIFLFSPIFSLVISIMVWLRTPFLFKLLSFKLRLLFMLRIIILRVYFFILSGWASNSVYSLLGSLRSIAQSVSYEVCIILIILSFIFLINRINLVNFIFYQKYIRFFFINFILRIILFIIFLAETNRSPFDFSEGESELVSGFNTEYRRGRFAFIFLSEYSRILFIRIIFCLIFLNRNIVFFFYFIKILIISFLFLLVRRRFPRLRYDKLINLT